MLKHIGLSFFDVYYRLSPAEAIALADAVRVTWPDEKQDRRKRGAVNPSGEMKR